ncbi:MAG: AAA family ATPase [Acidaminobacter sp.]|uniref:AAA family ATPase n=1 Tax=Acidaminobacter sp. TaxID=1872102 RepID=UPI00137CD270|nr:AAA family ATPase [Acidaminobacter sp.]MZQ99497.1 AAA family ATPase [Acidaminobacter sp.]
MKLISIELINFKGLKQKKINADGHNVTIRGANGAGKTTIFDAWLWLLFGKDSTGRSSFEVKTVDSFGRPIHGLDHIVEAVIEHEDNQITLRKEYREKWTKKRGDSEAQLSGHETSCFIDSLPVKISDYTAKINEMMNEELFKLLSDPTQFQRLDWKKRRDLMMSLIKYSDDSLLDNPQFEPVRELIKKFGSEDAMTLLKDRRKKLNEQIKQIPIRVDEVSRTTYESPQSTNFETVEAKLAELLQTRNDVEKRAREEARKRIDEQAKVLDAISHNKNQIKEFERIRTDAEKEKNLARSELERVCTEIQSKKDYIANFAVSQQSIKSQIVQYENERLQLVKEYKASKAEVLNINEVDTICPTCGQGLPPSKTAEIIEIARAKFENAKQKGLADITQRGATLKTRIEGLAADIASGETKLDNARISLMELNVRKAELEKLINHPVPDFADKVSQMTEHIQSLNEKLQIRIEINMNDTSKLDAEIATLQKLVAQKDAFETSKGRIGELEAEGKKLANELVISEGQIIALENYIKAKVEMIETELNSLFRSVTFKLFDTQINGGLADTFVTLINGVPYQDANTASQINAGLEIIEHLSRYYNFRAPVFVDHRESVSALATINSQIINLLVDEKHIDLKTEREAV